MKPIPTYDDIASAVARTGLTARGGFHPMPTDAVPTLASGAAPETVILVGNVGSGFWESFRASPHFERERNPLDAWSREVVSVLALELGAEPLFPFGGPPWLPFLRWAERADTVWPSLMGPLIHPRFGLWHAYRGALSFAARIELPPREEEGARRPCDDCAERPCLAPCPVGAVAVDEQGAAAFNPADCGAWLTNEPRSECRTSGCLARRACPVGQQHAYHPEHAAFHMTAFARANAA